MTQQSKIISIAIIVLALIAVGIFWLVESINLYTIPTREEEPVVLTIAAAPEIAPWVNEMAEIYAARNRNVSIVVQTVEGARAESVLDSGLGQLPDVWIPEASFVRYLYQSPPYVLDGASLTSDGLLWVDPAGGLPLDWTAVHDEAVSNFQFDIALPARRTVGRLATCGSAGAAFFDQPTLTSTEASNRDFRDWMEALLEAVPNPSRNPVDQLISRPPAVEIGLILSSSAVELPQSYGVLSPQYNVILDYPYLARARWGELPADEAAAREGAVADFEAYLLSDDAQAALIDYGFVSQPATTPAATLDQNAVRALQWCWN